MSASAETQPAPDLLELAQQIGRGVLAPHADAVDADARFPAEAVAAMRQARLLSAMLPAEVGGAAAGVGEVARLCHALAQHCGNSAMVFAMHQIQVACLLRHGGAAPWQRGLLRRIAREQLLLASATTEGATGGDVGRSACALTWAEDRFALEKHGAVISYGEQADGVLATARRDESAGPTDQALAVLLRPEFQLTRTQEWNALGMRGTCSHGYTLQGTGAAAQVLPDPYAEIAARTMLPVSHILWAAVWTGIAAGALARAQAFLRAQARRTPGTIPPGAARLAEAVTVLQQASGAVSAAARRHAAGDGGGFALAIEMNTLKIGASRAAVQAIGLAMEVCGLSGYRSDTPYSLGRHLRDAHSAPLMVSNDRILANTAQMLLVQPVPGGLAP